MRDLVYLTIFCAIVVIIALIALPAPAWSCGGFFCNRSVPIDQTGEHIVFAVGDGYVEAHVLIQYQGPAEQFAWIVPTPGLPEVDVSADILFDVMNQTNPVSFAARYETIGDCEYNCPPPPRQDCPGEYEYYEWDAYDYWGAADMGVSDTTAWADSAADADSGYVPPVIVIAESSVGPFEFAILRATEAEPLLEWLQENSYDIPDEALPLIEPYVMAEGDMHFVAFRLEKESDVGDLQPIRLRFEADEPMIPIQLTAIASVPDMEITTHILAEGRAFPRNYANVTLNPLQRDWFGWNAPAEYREAISGAVDEAGGHAWVTEYAGPAIVPTVFTAGRYDTGALAELADPVEFLRELASQGFQADPLLLEILREFLPVPGWVLERGLDAQDYYNCLFAFRGGRGGGGWDGGYDYGYGSDGVFCFGELVTFEEFDPVAFAARLDERIVLPLQRVQAMFDEYDYLTRLTTRLDADEMTVDPGFAILEDAPEVASSRRATQTVDCGTFELTETETTRVVGGDYFEAPPWLEVPGLAEIITREATPSVVAEMPSVLRVELLGDDDTILVDVDNTEAIDDVTIAWNADREAVWAPQPLICDIHPEPPPCDGEEEEEEEEEEEDDPSRTTTPAHPIDPVTSGVTFPERPSHEGFPGFPDTAENCFPCGIDDFEIEEGSDGGGLFSCSASQARSNPVSIIPVALLVFGVLLPLRRRRARREPETRRS